MRVFTFRPAVPALPTSYRLDYYEDDLGLFFGYLDFYGKPGRSFIFFSVLRRVCMFYLFLTKQVCNKWY